MKKSMSVMTVAAGLLVSACNPPWVPRGEECPEYDTPARISGPALAKTADCAPPPWDPWNKPAPAAYAFTYTRQCFCPPEGRGPFLVTMTGDSVTSVRRVAGAGDTVAVTEDTQAFALETIWMDARERYWSISSSDPAAEKFIRHDAEWGFVDSFYVDPHRNVADDEGGFSVTSFRVLEP